MIVTVLLASRAAVSIRVRVELIGMVIKLRPRRLVLIFRRRFLFPVLRALVVPAALPVGIVVRVHLVRMVIEVRLRPSYGTPPCNKGCTPGTVPGAYAAPYSLNTQRQTVQPLQTVQ